jgi:hypothetical protein
MSSAPDFRKSAAGHDLFDRAARTAGRSTGSSSSSARNTRRTAGHRRAPRLLTLEGDRLWLDLFGSTLHEYEAADPSRYRTNRSEAQRS